MIEPEDIVEGECADWYRLAPLERWRESQKLWVAYLQMRGSLDPEPDTESPFHNIYFGKGGAFENPNTFPSGLNTIRRDIV